MDVATEPCKREKRHPLPFRGLSSRTCVRTDICTSNPHINLKITLIMSETPTRLVPGAPPPAPLSKSQKKKRKGAKSGDISEAASPLVVSTPLGASQIETAPSATEVKEGLVAPQLTATLSVDAQSAVGDDLGYKPSPVVDLVHKRLKATHKKIVSHSRSLKTFSAFCDHWVA